jgi:hypothetical protein
MRLIFVFNIIQEQSRADRLLWEGIHSIQFFPRDFLQFPWKCSINSVLFPIFFAIFKKLDFSTFSHHIYIYPNLYIYFWPVTNGKEESINNAQ